MMTGWIALGSFPVIPDFEDLPILVVGDPITDIYHFGRVERISPEAPVPVFVREQFERRRGGADNVAHQLEVLGCTVGTDFPDRPWEKKHRYMVGSHQLLRVDEPRYYLQKRPVLVDGFKAIVLSDYAKGWLSKERCQQVIGDAQAHKIPVIVDPKGNDWSKYDGATVICPNENEYQHGTAWTGSMVVKLGANGMDVIEDTTTHIPAKAKHVFDVTGAGDVVTALIASGLGIGLPLVNAAHIAAAAAGYVVGEVGTTVCPLHKLRELME